MGYNLSNQTGSVLELAHSDDDGLGVDSYASWMIERNQTKVITITIACREVNDQGIVNQDQEINMRRGGGRSQRE